MQQKKYGTDDSRCMLNYSQCNDWLARKLFIFRGQFNKTDVDTCYVNQLVGGYD